MTPFNAFVEANDYDSLSRLLQAGNQEAAQIECKKSTVQLTPAFQSLCAFLNNGGGVVLIGIKDDGTLVGQVVSDKIRQELAVELTKIEPYPYVSIRYIPMHATYQVIKLIASPEAQSVPYAYDARPYDRHESSTVRMAQIRYTELIQNRLFQTNPCAISCPPNTLN